MKLLSEHPIFSQVQRFEINHDLWFLGQDITRVLGYTVSRNVLARHVKPENRRKYFADLGRGYRYVTVINDDGIFSLVSHSKLPTAKKLQDWLLEPEQISQVPYGKPSEISSTLAQSDVPEKSTLSDQADHVDQPSVNSGEESIVKLDKKSKKLPRQVLSIPADQLKEIELDKQQDETLLENLPEKVEQSSLSDKPSPSNQSETDNSARAEQNDSTENDQPSSDQSNAQNESEIVQSLNSNHDSEVESLQKSHILDYEQSVIKQFKDCIFERSDKLEIPNTSKILKKSRERRLQLMKNVLFEMEVSLKPFEQIFDVSEEIAKLTLMYLCELKYKFNFHDLKESLFGDKTRE